MVGEYNDEGDGRRQRRKVREVDVQDPTMEDD